MIDGFKAERDNRIDVVKGVCIVLMVWGHLPQMGTQAPLLENLVIWIYTFHMPVFVLITGYLFGKKQGEWREFGMVLNRMLKPYLFGAVVSMFLYWAAARLGVGTTTEHEFTDFWQIINSILQGRCGALWYLWAFGCVELAVLLALRYGMRIVGRDCLLWVVAMVSVVVVVLAGYQFNFHIKCIPFFFIGFILRRCNIPLPCSWLFIMPIAILLMGGEDVSIGTFANYIWVISILGFLMWVAVLFHRVCVCGGGGGIGKHTLTILLFHSIISVGLRPLSPYVLKLEPTGILLSVIMCSAIVSLCLVIELIVNKTKVRKIIWAG